MPDPGDPDFLPFAAPADRVRFAADTSIRRALLFAAIGIGTLMLSLTFDPYLAIRAGAALVTTAAVILYAMGQWAPGRPYRRTEAWILLDKQHRFGSDARAQQVFGATLRERYWWHARVIALIALPMWAMALLMLVTRMLARA